MAAFHALARRSATRRTYSQPILRFAATSSGYRAAMNAPRLRLVRHLLIAAALIALAAVPVLAGNPNAPGQQKEKTPSAPITIAGTVEKSTDAEGETVYTLADGGKTYKLEAGPKWFFEAYPLEQYVGQSVTIDGEIAEGSDVVEVLSVNGTALRAAGKPPWAGGWKAVGEKHPGWSQEKADRFKEKFGDCFPPGQCKEKPNKGADDEADPE
jgi:hypothetical protein